MPTISVDPDAIALPNVRVAVTGDPDPPPKFES
jgi:hypothetical protein